jgi:hypothetical protein
MDVFLPVPRVPVSSFLGAPPVADLEVVAPDAAAAVVEVQRLTAEALAAEAAVEDARPGGAGWAEALRLDGELVVAGRPAKHAAALLVGDAQRWGQASAVCRTLAARSRAVMAGVDLSAVAAAATVRRGEVWSVLDPLLAAAYDAAADGSTRAAWDVFNDVEPMVAELARLDRIEAWAAGDTSNLRRSEGVPKFTAAGLGFYRATRQLLGLDRPPLTLDPAITWPDGFDVSMTNRTRVVWS